MRLWAVLSEAWRNVGAGTTHALVMAIAVLLAGGLLGGYEAVSVETLESQAVTRIRAYADVKTVVGAPVDGAACDALAAPASSSASSSGLPSVSGAMRQGSQVTPLATPGRDVSSYEVTPGMIRLIAATDHTRRADASGVWVSTAMARDFGLTTGSPLPTDKGATHVAGVFDWPNDGRDTRFAYAIVTPVSPSDGTFEECWAKQWPADSALDTLLLSVARVPDVAGASPGSAGVTALNKGFDSHYDAQASYANRPTRSMPYAGLAIGLLMGVIAVRRRRLEYAGALHSGQSKGAQLFGVGVETLVWSGAGTIVSISLIGAYCARMVTSDPLAVFQTAIRTPIALLAGALVAALLTALTIRESQLFHYFKTR